MAGSYDHVTHVINGESQFIGCTLLDGANGDAFEALEEMWFLVRFLGKDDTRAIRDALNQFYRPSDPLAVALKARLQTAHDNLYWSGELDNIGKSEDDHLKELE